MLTRINKAMAKKDSGFTLIELLVVVIIIGILAAIAIPTFLSQRENGWRAQVTSDIRNAVTNAEAFAVTANGTYTGLTLPAVQNGIATTNTTLTLGAFTPTAGDFCIKGVSTKSATVTLYYRKSLDSISTTVC